MDRRPLEFWINTLDASYLTTSTAYTGSEGGFPVGDLNWFPTKKAEWETWITDVKVEEGYVPESFSLQQNYPNPFNPSTKITFSVPQSGFTTLSVYNLLGEKVATLLSQELSAGKYTIDFNASNLSTGVYFYNLDSGDFSAIKKMIILK